MEHVVQTVQETHPGLMFYFVYKITAGGVPIEHAIECDLTAPMTLVISEQQRNVYTISIIVGPDDKREWCVDEIISLKFGFRREIL